MSTSAPPGDLVVVGVGADGWPGLGDPARRALLDADVVFGSSRQLDLLPPEATAPRRAWPAPLLPALQPLLAEHAGQRIAVLASGDPMFYGIGATLAALVGPGAMTVIAAPSSVSLACARLGWAVQDTEVVTVLARPLPRVLAAARSGRRFLVLLDTPASAASVAALLIDNGLPGSRLTLLSRLGSAQESTVSATAADWAPAGGPPAVLAVEPVGPVLPLTPGLDIALFEHDGQITKPGVRALTLAALAPRPGELLWDVGAGSGSVGIEWMRAHPSCRTVAIEPDAERAARVRANADRFGVAELHLVNGRAPDALVGLPAPDAVFVGGGLTATGVLETCLAALGPGGRLVANAVTLETESVVLAAHARLGGSLTRISLSHAAPVGGFTGWRSPMPITQWAYEHSGQEPT